MTRALAIARMSVLVGLVGLATVGCGESKAVGLDAGPDDAGADGNDGLPACVRRWTVTDSRVNPGLDVKVTGGALAIALPLAADELVFVGHEGALTGDFEVSFDFAVFAPGTTSAYLHATLGLQDPNLIDVPFVGAGIGVNEGQTDVRALLVYHDEGRTRFDLALTRATEGTLRLARIGRAITLTASVPSGETATIAAQVSDAPAYVGLQFASGSRDDATGDASVEITDFRVQGGGGAVTTDHFDCDSLL
jgi:hypothetical protein